MKNKKTRRFSLSVLALVLVILALLAIPASASGYDYYSFEQKCGCTGEFLAYCDSQVTSIANGSNARTVLNHYCSGCSSAQVYVSAKFWHYPSPTSSAYNATTLTNSATGIRATAVVSETPSIGEVFCIESNHRITTVCNGTTYSYSDYNSNGEPAMK